MTWIEDHLPHIVVALLLAMIVMVAAVVVASIPRHELTVAPDGQPAWLVTCSTPGDCVTECAATCPAGYQVLSQTAERGEVTTYTHVSSGSGTGVSVPVTTPTYSGATLIRCGKAPQ